MDILSSPEDLTVLLWCFYRTLQCLCNVCEVPVQCNFSALILVGCISLVPLPSHAVEPYNPHPATEPDARPPTLFESSQPSRRVAGPTAHPPGALPDLLRSPPPASVISPHSGIIYSNFYN